MFAYRRMPFGLCNAPGTFQRCMMAIFHDMIEKIKWKVFMGKDFQFLDNSFSTCITKSMKKLLKRFSPSVRTSHLSSKWERKKHSIMVTEGNRTSGLKLLGKGIEVDKSKIDVIS
ncbi:hypothetical protein Tco_1368425 [Tanacetum coccineum]